MKGQGGQTPLMSAVIGGKHKAVNIMMQMDADPTIAEEHGLTAMHAAAFKGQRKVTETLLRYGIGALPRNGACRRPAS